MKAQTPEFVNREEALEQSERLFTGAASATLAFNASDGLGKSFLLRELGYYCKAGDIRALLIETSRAAVASHWDIIRRIADQWPDMMARSAAMLDRIEASGVLLEKLPGGGVFIGANANVVIQGDVVGGNKINYESDAQAREYRGLDAQLMRAFFLDLSELCGGATPPVKSNGADAQSDAAHNLPGPLCALLCDNVDDATQETCTWLAEVLRRMWAGDLPGLRVVIAGQTMPTNLVAAAGDRLESLALTPFKAEHVAQYIRFFGLPSTEAADAFRFSGGVPATLKLIVNNWLKTR